ncbi:hypothetical protein C2G38_2189598 [Gigaspora rosea]|uniref:Uncharacterized protein n=1 Tax=Gigaspora rosea TaxID=44941 RepID=A0A397V2D0_9GLOM|nr:hypothetical protein C2G38_2189598 [Gigaspora rosea]
MTDNQLTKFQEIINEIFGNDYIDNSQLLQALKLVLEIFEDIIDSKNEEAVLAKKGDYVKMDKNMTVRVKNNRPEASDWYQRSAEEGNIEGYFKAQARIGLCCENKNRAKKNSNISSSIYNQKLDQVPDTNFKNQPKLDKQSRLDERSDTNRTHKAKYCYQNNSNATDASIVDKVNRVKLDIYWFQKPQKMRGIFQVDPGYQDGIEIKPNIEAPKLDNESSYEKIAPNPISGYLEEPENAGDDAETWYPCNDEIPEDWLGLNDCKDFVTSIIEDEFKSGERIEYIDKAEKAQISQNNYLLNGIRVEHDEHRASTKYLKPMKIYRASRTRNSYQDSIKSNNDRSKTKGRIGPKHLRKAKTKNNWKTKTPNKQKRKRADKLDYTTTTSIYANSNKDKKTKVEKDNYDASIYHRKSAEIDMAAKWMSGNKDINGCMKEFQLRVWKYKKTIEWIPFDRLSDVKEID